MPETTEEWLQWEQDRQAKAGQAYDARQTQFPETTVKCRNRNCREYGKPKTVPDIGQEVECGACRQTIREAK